MTPEEEANLAKRARENWRKRINGLAPIPHTDFKKPTGTVEQQLNHIQQEHDITGELPSTTGVYILSDGRKVRTRTFVHDTRSQS